MSEERLDAHSNEFEWRFNNRQNPYLFRDTLAKLVNSGSLPFEQLVKAKSA